MRGVIVKRRVAVAEALRWLFAGIPERLVRLWRGPTASAEITANGLGKVTGASRLRPVSLTVAPDAMLPMRLVIPSEGRNELRHAVALAIRQDTPFEPDEVVALAVEAERGAGSETYLVHAVPKRLIADAVGKVGHLRLDRVSVASLHGPDLATAMFPWRRARPWLAALPLAVILVVMGLGAHGVLAEQQRQAAGLEIETAVALAQLRELSDELEGIEARATAGKQIAAKIGAAPVAFVLLDQARHLLSSSTEVAEVELRAGELRLSLRTADALADMALFVEAGWSAAIEGAITADPMSGREIATLRLSLPTEAE